MGGGGTTSKTSQLDLPVRLDLRLLVVGAKYLIESTVLPPYVFD